MTAAPSIGQIGGQTGIASGLDRTQSKESLKKAGEQFESVFTAMMLKSMRQAKLSDPLFDSKAIDTFRDMSDQKIVQEMATHTPLGIGKAMTDFLGRSQPDLNPAGATPEG
ncbi:rod-binding protein [Sphingomonas sp. Leaf412]|uniref:rod-binding protein n=1 Tax=Sphingomonas sp. Leaf412 TaxID=1736370 RepID=UPI0006FFA0DC|nr:rod-binding protein [Sphingomonas sp. Leaf412]KQT35139.1 rod-binding protein [Sphingomonas sp. Leaf412]